MNQELKELTIEILQRCPNKCVYCSSLSNINATHQLSYKDIIHVANQAKDLGLKRLCLSGGEPLYHPDIVKIVNSISRLNLEISIYTTGLYPAEYKSGASFHGWDNFRNKESITLIFNIQSIHAEIHDRITSNPGSFGKTKDALLSAKNKGFRIENHIVPNKLNYETLEATVEGLIDWGVNKISFLRFVPQGYAKLNRDLLFMTDHELKILNNKIKSLSLKIYNNAHLRFGIPFSHELNKSKKCNAAENKLIVRYDGKVLPCEAFKDLSLSEFILGDIWNMPLLDMLYKGQRLTSLNMAKIRVAYNMPCESCPAQLIYNQM